MISFSDDILERFVRYAKVDTMSDEHMRGKRRPSSDGQWDLLRMLEKELRAFGLKDVELDSLGYLLARIPGNTEAPSIGLMAHVDTADAVPGNGVKPVVVKNYQGGDIPLKSGAFIKVEDNPELLMYHGGTIVTSEGDTLLGGDDKAGVAIIMSVAKYLVEHPEVKHGEVELLFSTDEEIGAGMDDFDPKRLHSHCCYTLDGEGRYQVESECFNGAVANVHFSGIGCHLGSARGKMVNAVTMAAAFINSLPQAESPEATDGRCGYYCPLEVRGNSLDADLEICLRDFDFDNLKRRISVLEGLAKVIEDLYVGGKATVTYQIQYKNMAEATKLVPEAMTAIEDAAKKVGFEPIHRYIRGGTDGARLAEKGIPTPNIFTGDHNLHSLDEWLSITAANEAANFVVAILERWTEEF